MFLKNNFIFAIFLSFFIFAQITSAQSQAPDTTDVKPKMHTLFSNIKDLVPYMVSEEKFSDPKNNEFILKKLKEISKTANETEHTSLIKSPTYKVSSEVLKSHFSEIERVFRVGNKNYARWQLNSTVPLCMSCHTQMPSHSRHWDLSDLTSKSISDYERGEIFFMGRDFDSAMKFYDEAISKYPQNKLSVQSLEKSFERKLVIFSRVTRDFDKGIENLELSLKNKQLPDYLIKNVKAWIALFRIQKRESFPNPLNSQDKDIRSYAEKTLTRDLWEDMVDASNPRIVKVLTLSGVLYEYLNKHPKTALKPDILNWLAKCDRHLQETLFYSLSDLYLKQCMQEFPNHPTAKKCFQDYKENLIFSYSGSSGVNLPDDVKKEIQDWSDKILKTQKKTP